MKVRELLTISWPWVLAGIVSGMAILTRATGLVLVGVVGLALLLRLVSDTRAGERFGQSVNRALLSGIVWLVSAVGTVLLLFPALWVAPAETLDKLWSWSSGAATDGHENPTFFRGIHYDDPGLLVYPVVLAWKTSPAEWLGLALLIIFGSWAWRRRSQTSAKTINFLIVCVVFAAVYVVAMSIGAKKFDRYVLPVFPIVALLAAQGLMLGKRWLAKLTSVRWKHAGYTLIVLAVVIQALSWQSTRPYRLDYYNPLLGGAQRAQHVLQIGWGQGGDKVVEFLEARAIDGPITVQTSAVPSAFTYFLDDDSPVQFRSFSLGTPAGWFETDYYVAGIQQTQRDLAPGYDLMSEYDPVHSVEIGGVAYFETYNVSNLPLPNELMSPTACNFTFGESITLMQIIGREDTIDFYFLSSSNADQDVLEFEIGVTWPDGSNTVETAVLSPAPAGKMSRLTIPYQRADASLAEGEITMRVSEDSQPLGITSPWMDGQSDVGVTQSECFYTEPPTES